MNTIQIKTGTTPEKVQDLLTGSKARELILDASSGFVWVKDPNGNKLRIAGPRATASFWFKGIVQKALTAYPGSICDVGDVLFLQAASTIDETEIPAGSLIVKVADTADGVGSWYAIDKVTQTSLKVSSSLFEATTLIDALEEIAARTADPDGVNIVSANGKLSLKEEITVGNVFATGGSTGVRREACTKLGTVDQNRTTFLLFKKNLQDVSTYLCGEIFQSGTGGISHTDLSLSAIGSKNFSSVSSSANGRVRLVTCSYAGFIWYGLKFPADQESTLYFSGWKAIGSEMAPPKSGEYSDADLTNVSILTEDDNSDGFSITDSLVKKSVEIGDSFYLGLSVTNSPADFLGPRPGSMYFDSDLKMPMVYLDDGWESVARTQLTFGASAVDGQYLSFNGASSNATGALLPHAAVIKSISVLVGKGELTKAFEIRKNGDETALASFSLVDGKYSADASIKVSKLDFLQVFASPIGNKANDVVAVLELAYTK